MIEVRRPTVPSRTPTVFYALNARAGIEAQTLYHPRGNSLCSCRGTCEVRPLL
jgi:hypothetical protein